MTSHTGPFWDAVEGRAPLPNTAATLGLEVLDVDSGSGTIELAFNDAATSSHSRPRCSRETPPSPAPPPPQSSSRSPLRTPPSDPNHHVAAFWTPSGTGGLEDIAGAIRFGAADRAGLI